MSSTLIPFTTRARALEFSKPSRAASWWCWACRYRGTEEQRYRGTEVQRYRGTEVQRYRGTEVQRYRVTDVQRYRGTEVQRYRGREVTEVQSHRCTEVQSHRCTEVLRCRGREVTEVQSHRCTEVLRCRGLTLQRCQLAGAITCILSLSCLSAASLPLDNSWQKKVKNCVWLVFDTELPNTMDLQILYQNSHY